MRPAQHRLATAALGAAIALAALLAGCGTASRGGGPSGTGARPPSDLGTVEVREYRGEKLGSVQDFRENSIKGVQHVDRTTYRLAVDGAVARPAKYTYADVLTKESTHTKVVTLDCVEGWSVKVLWEGVLLSDLIDRARPEDGANTVIFHCADGYTTSLPLDYIRSNRILLAYGMNGIEMPEERGFPFQVVAESKWGYKWAKWITEIELSKNSDYRGFWESRGYSRSGDLNQGP